MKIFDFVKILFNKAIRAFKAFILEAIPVARQIMVGQLASFAKKVVLELESTDFSNEEKRERAFLRIKNYAIKAGIDAKDSLINAVVELAVLSWKKEF